MSGEKFNRSLERRTFIKWGGLLLAAPFLNSCNLFSGDKFIPVKIAGANSKTGHLLRENKFPEPSSEENIHTLIVGGGIGGLSAARWLKKSGVEDFKLVELDTNVGGNSKCGQNEITKYPFAAHYLPIPNEKFKELIDFLAEHKIITGFDEVGLPIYNDYYLCFEPEERLFYRGIWVDGIPPKEGMSESEINELKRFLATTENYKVRIGSDQKTAFCIPLEESSNDAEFRDLDKITVREYLQREGYKSDFLYWYLNYCCKDDFGSSIDQTSAWAGIHYFSARNGKASNAQSYDLLTWPEGNHFLADKLEQVSKDHLLTQMLTFRIEEAGDVWHCLVYDVEKSQTRKFICKNVILATPQFVNKHLLPNEKRIEWNDFNYYPWLVANVSISNKKELNGKQTLSWDNVLYNSKSLGYVNACHQNVDQTSPRTVLTYYFNFSELPAREEREAIYEKGEEYWKQFILADLKKAHSTIEEIVDQIEVNILGHGMISPNVNFLSLQSRENLQKGYKNLHFAHSDVSGISIFEQAFYRGIIAAKKIIEENA